MASATTIPTITLILSEGFGERLGAQRVGEAIAAGLLEAGAPPADLCPVAGAVLAPERVRQRLDELDFERRMRAARAVVLAVPALAEETLAASLAFEGATMARQGGVPCYAVTAVNRLNAFDLRILDLQLVIEAGTTRTLRSAGRRLGKLI